MNKPAPTAQVIFMPSGKKGQFAQGTPVLDCARALGVDIDSVCGGRGICGRCQIEVGVGHFAKHQMTSYQHNLESLTKPEELYDTRKNLKSGRRLACHARLAGDVLIDVPPESQLHKQIVRKRVEARSIEIDPVIRLHYVEVAQPDMSVASGDYERLREALADQWELEIDGIDLDALMSMQKALRDGDWKVTAAVHRGTHIVRLYPGFHDKSYGFAVDVGSTTIAAHLCDLSSGEVFATGGLMNPQIRFGEDLMSRVSYAMMNDGGAKDMTAAVRAGINTLFREALFEAEISAQDVLAATFVGNPVMHHLLLGLDPEPLGFAPFALAADTAMDICARDLELETVPASARCYFLPCIAGHVGADTAAMILAETPYLNDETTLLVDIGTNAELVLGNNKRLLAASSPTGPAFEGAQISSGQRAAPGAIERVRIDPVTYEPRFRVIGCDIWSDEDGFSEAVCDIGVMGICGSGIIEVLAEMFLAGLLTSDGVIVGSKAVPTRRLRADGRTTSYLLHEGPPDIWITQTDVRAIQLAKGALYAGAQLLLDELGQTKIDRITLAGAFGSQIDIKYAMILGLIPDCDLKQVSSAGNAAGTGSRIALLNVAARDEIEERVRKIEKIETALAPRFQEHFVDAMAIPHKTADFANLKRVVNLPSSGPEKSRRRRRARQS